MKSQITKIEGRVSRELRALVEQGGEKSAAMRALLIIGAAACGLDLVNVREEIPDLVSKRLRPEVRAQLLVLITGSGERPRATPVAEPVEDYLYEDDELLLGDADGAGFDV